MSKIEVTDEMKSRAYKAAQNAALGLNKMLVPIVTIEAILDAALNPPPDPEIEVTEEMRQAVRPIMNRWLNYTEDSKSADDFLVTIYRAMRKLERKDEQAAGPFFHRREWDHKPGGPGSGIRYHRRKGDPQ